MHHFEYMNQNTTLHALAILITLLFTQPTIASVFGSKSYSECVLDNMKNQDKSMKQTVENFCEEKFPYEKRLYKISGNTMDIIEWSSTSGKTGLTLTYDPSELTPHKLTTQTFDDWLERAKIENPKSTTTDLTYYFHHKYGIPSEIDNSTYRITRIVATFSTVSCDSNNSKEQNTPKKTHTFLFKNSNSLTINTNKLSYKCLHNIDIYGKLLRR